MVYALNTDVYVDYSTFANNSASTADAGALYLDCESTAVYRCSYTISNSIFKNNTAAINGGAIKYTYYKPNSTINNSFSLNTAKYGNDMASYPA